MMFISHPIVAAGTSPGMSVVVVNGGFVPLVPVVPIRIIGVLAQKNPHVPLFLDHCASCAGFLCIYRVWGRVRACARKLYFPNSIEIIRHKWHRMPSARIFTAFFCASCAKTSAYLCQLCRNKVSE